MNQFGTRASARSNSNSNKDAKGLIADARDTASADTGFYCISAAVRAQNNHLIGLGSVIVTKNGARV